jgi:hypothetical protein
MISNNPLQSTGIITYYPPFEDNETYTDHYYRLIWYLNPIIDDITEIVIPYRGKLPQAKTLPDYLDSEILTFESRFDGKLTFVSVDDALVNYLQLCAASEAAVLWRITRSGKDKMPEGHGKSILQHKTVWRVDHHIERHASSFYLKLSSSFRDGLEEATEICQQKFQEINREQFQSAGFIMGTGPNLQQVKEFDFSKTSNIACNSMVKNIELMRQIKPPLIVIADPIFHAGCSRYAGEFRHHLRVALDEFDSYLIVPLRDYRLYMSNLGERYQDRIVGVPFQTADTPNLDLYKNFHVTSTNNVMTLFLLPLASTFFDEIYLAGFDGRPLEENDYFWKHDPASQLTDRMDDIKRAHPAFFNIDYDDYYVEHLDTVAKWIHMSEQEGKIFHNITPSYIPAIVKHSIPGIETLVQEKPNTSTKPEPDTVPTPPIKISQQPQPNQLPSLLISKLEGLWLGLFISITLSLYALLALPGSTLVAFIAWIPFFAQWTIRARKRWIALSERLMSERDHFKHELVLTKASQKAVEPQLLDAIDNDKGLRHELTKIKRIQAQIQMRLSEQAHLIQSLENAKNKLETKLQQRSDM